MVARVRTYEETGDMYADNLREEAKVMKQRLKGRWVWKTFYPIDSMENLPNNAVVLERDPDHGHMVPTKTFDPKNKQHFVKFPPYVRLAEKTPRIGALRREQQRHVREEREGSISSTTPNTDEGRRR